VEYLDENEKNASMEYSKSLNPITFLLAGIALLLYQCNLIKFEGILHLMEAHLA
jgi:hypothetical protein